MKRLLLLAMLTTLSAVAQIQQAMPPGLMIAMDFESVEGGLIPSKALYPLYTPMGDLNLEWHNGRKVLVFPENAKLDIPHSALLDPSGEEWIVSLRVFCLTDGVILSQYNDEHGFALCFMDGQFMAWIKSGSRVFKLEESASIGKGISKFHKKWVTIEVRIRDGMAILYLNRTRVAMAMNQPALKGDTMRIRFGQPASVPAPFADMEDLPRAGFTGAISSFKIMRQ